MQPSAEAEDVDALRARIAELEEAAKRSNTRKVMHSSATPEWKTPAAFVEAARLTMGGIDLDPASSAEANLVVRAETIYTKENSGLEQPWFGALFVNPPGGLVDEFWDQLVVEWSAGRVTQAIWIGFSLQQLQTLQNKNRREQRAITPLDFPLCFPKSRISFQPGAGQPGGAPGHGNFIAFLPPPDEASIARFVQHHEPFGRVLLNGFG